FVQGLQAALDRSPLFASATITLDRSLTDGGAHFSPGVLTLPLAGEETRFGTLQVAPAGEHRQFDAEDLHLMAGLADFLGVALTQALRVQDAGRSRELLRFLLNQAPIGLAAYTPERRLLVANDQAAQWLGAAGPPFLEIEAGPGNFHLRTGGKLIYGEARRAPDGMWVIALHDLTPAQVRLMEALQREVYRGRVDHHPVTLLLVESPTGRDGVMRRLPALRSVLAAGELAGPYDATRIGIVLTGAGSVAGRRRLRTWQELFEGIAGLRAASAELGRDGDSPEALLEAALRRPAAYGETARPALLVHEGDPGVADAMSLVLRRDYRLVRCTDPVAAREQLRREEFDLLITELDPRGEAAGLPFAAEARGLQPALRTLFTSVHAPPYELPSELAVEGVPVVRKPFRPDELVQAVRHRLAT
ncbi:MAG: hypothetical protein ACHQ5A_01735, partial [Opitutales bacterium]